MHWKNVWSASLVLVLSLASARGRSVQQASPPAPPQDGAAASRPAPAAPRPVTGMIAGKVLLNGIAPARRQIQVTEPRAERPEGQPLLTEDVVLSPAGELRNVVVRIVRGMEGKDFTVPHPTPLLDHSGCQYRPHVLAMLPGQLGVIHNDPFVHNVHASCLLNKPFNKAQAAAGRRDDFPLERPEAVRIACDVHAWEFAWVVVCENPCFAVTADDGSFSFPAPPGTYTVEAWHERLGARSAEVTVVAGQTVRQHFLFDASGGSAVPPPAAGVLTAVPAQPPARPPAPPASRPDAGTITGKVVLNGAPPRRTRIQVTEAVCRANYTDDKPLLSEEVIASPTGELRNVVVRIVKGMEGKEFPVELPAPVLQQIDCRFVPHVLAMVPGRLTVSNNDATLHNVHSQSQLNRQFNKGQLGGKKDVFELRRPEVVKISCDVHGWMSAYVVVCENPCFAVTGDDGSFSFPAPPGTYTVEAWHEKLGTQSVEVTVTAGKASKQYFTFEPRK